ncbi:DUF7221 family queuine tRNA-ribosyltransferase-like protein [Paraburkholderia hospita]|uniref:deazapurine DNA modification protein DpdA family protein n=1 Tax=Paraburkholderia hospita TaxID=169430 RepID=UPI0008A731FA|nr:hypothetical protein [Paraburkholderia hospita]SEI20769.1 hypothetical protein SAMN05192544_103816 [Paraburkholderia hospita]
MTFETHTSDLPVCQSNANVDDGLLIRVGIPHRGGKLAFHAFNEDYSAMVSAAAFWNAKTGRFSIPDATDLSEINFALDSAGFTAMMQFQAKGRQAGIAGVYPWTMEQFVELASLSGASWVAQPDMCCEPAIAPNQEAIDYRINATATLLEDMLRVVYAWQSELAKTLNLRSVQNMVRIPVPVAQGWTVDDYRRSIDLMMQVWERWMPWIAPPALIGLGSVCRRHLTDPKHGLFAILEGIEGHVPPGSRLHLFGVKGQALERVKMYDWVASADSMAFDFAARIEARKSGQSNTIAHRANQMDRWMRSATQRATPAGGDQYRLAFHA